MRDHRRFLDILRRTDEDKIGLRLVDDQASPFELDFPAVAPITDNDDLWDIEVPAEEAEIEEVSIEDKSLDQIVADLVLDEEEAIEGYENAEEVIVANEEISEEKKDEILAVLDHIKEEEEEHIDELTELALSTEEDNSEDKIDEGSEDEEIEVANASEDDDGLAKPVSKEARHKLDLAEELCEDLDKQDISAEVKGFMYNTSAKPSSGLVERIIKYMNDFGGMEPLARDLSEEDPTDVDTENASTITVAWEDGEYVERLDTLATACWEADDTYAGFEYLFTLLYLSGIAVDSAEDTLKEDLKAPEGGEGSKQVFIDLSGSSHTSKDALTAAAIADGHKKDEIIYFDDFGFIGATKAAKQGHNVFLYTKDDDYRFNSDLEKFPNVKIKIVSNETMQGGSSTSLKEGWDDQIAKADKYLDIIVNKTGNHSYDDGDGYWLGDDEWCNRYLYYSNSVANTNQVKKLCDKYSTDVCKFYVVEDDAEEDPVSEIGYTLVSQITADADDLVEGKKLKEAALTKEFFTWTVGSKSYDILNNAELRAYIKAAAEEKLDTYVAKHPDRPWDTNVWEAYYDVFEELIAHYEAEPQVNHKFINRLRVLEDRILGDLPLDDEDDQPAQQEVEVLAAACIEQFLNEMKKLTAFYKYNIDQPYCQNPIDTIKEELVMLGWALAQPNYIEN